MQAADYLRKIPLFADLTSEEMVEVLRMARSVTFAPGETLCAQGSQADCLFVLETGEGIVRVRDPRGQAREVSRIKAGEVLGELGLVDGQPRSADVVATQAIRAYRLDRTQFDAMRAALRPAAFKMLRRIAITVSERLRDINTTISAQLAAGLTQSAQPVPTASAPTGGRVSRVHEAPAQAAVPSRASRVHEPPSQQAARPRTAPAAGPAPGPAPGPRVQALQAMLNRLSSAGHK